jgi:hypothetical protein
MTPEAMKEMQSMVSQMQGMMQACPMMRTPHPQQTPAPPEPPQKPQKK